MPIMNHDAEYTHRYCYEDTMNPRQHNLRIVFFILAIQLINVLICRITAEIQQMESSQPDGEKFTQSKIVDTKKPGKDESDEKHPSGNLDYRIAYAMASADVFIITYLLVLLTDCAKYLSPFKEICLVILTISAMGLHSAVVENLPTSQVKCGMKVGFAAAFMVILILFTGITLTIDLTKSLDVRNISIIFFFLFLIMSNLSPPFDILAILSFSVFVMYDMQRIVGGRHEEYQINEDEIVYMANRLFFNIIFLQLIIQYVLYVIYCSGRSYTLLDGIQAIYRNI